MIKSNIAVSALFILLLPIVAFAAKPEPARPELNFDKESVGPGETIKATVHFEIDKSWHVYGENPGDTGLPTKIKLIPNSQIEAGSISWPPVKTFTLPGNIVSYGYEDKVDLSLPLTVSATSEKGKELTVEMEVKWAACSADLCVPASRRFKKTIKVI